MNNQSIRLNEKQIKFLVDKTGASSPDEAVERFATILHEEKIRLQEMLTYLDRLMEITRAR